MYGLGRSRYTGNWQMSPQELIERVMTEHWDMAACRCAFCDEGRKMGFHPQGRYPTVPNVSILDERTKDGKPAIYDWSAK